MKRVIFQMVIFMLVMSALTFAQQKVEISISNITAISSGPVALDQRLLMPVQLPPELSNVVIDFAKINFKVDNASIGIGEGALGVSVYPLLSAWTSGSGWSTGWTHPGGDFADSMGVFNVVPTKKHGSAEIVVTELVQAWVDGKMPNHGLLMRSSKEGQHNLALAPGFSTVTLTVYYTKKLSGK